jgi:hypothetical protein
MPSEYEDVLGLACHLIYSAHKQAEEERKRELFGDSFPIELLATPLDKVRIVVHKENVRHNEPHMHITHSDKIDASVSLRDFRVLAGHIDLATMKHVQRRLRPVKGKLMDSWATLNDHNSSISAERLINSLFG